MKNFTEILQTFDDLNDHIRANYGFSLYLREEPTLMNKSKKPSQWVGAASPNIVLLRKSGYPPTKYPKCYGIINNGGYRPISISTLRSNIEKGRPLFIKI
jgi:hypothetical protein